MIKHDLETTELNKNDLKEMSKGEARTMIKTKIEKATFSHLQYLKKKSLENKTYSVYKARTSTIPQNFYNQKQRR